jgi:hypothetical protein
MALTRYKPSFFFLQVGSGIMRKEDPFQRQTVSGRKLGLCEKTTL